MNPGNKIEIQVLSQASHQQLIQLRDEIRKIEGLENFSLEIPPVLPRQGQMGVNDMILEAVLHATAHIALDKLLPIILPILSSIFKHPEKTGHAGVESMGKSDKAWEIVATTEKDQIRSHTYVNSAGVMKSYDHKDYSINASHTYALLIGVSEYDDKQHFPSIPPVEGNLLEMFKVFNDHRLMGLPMQNIRMLANETCENIKKELYRISKIPGIETLIIYYAGHGQNTGTNELSLIARDTYTLDEELHNDIEYKFIMNKIIEGSPAKQKIILLDACYSGLAAQSGFNVMPDIEPVVGSYTLASTSGEEASYFKKEAATTYFTASLLEVFKQGVESTNRMLSLDDLYRYTSKVLEKKQLPKPTCKTLLKNISAEKFFISGNLAFSMEELIKRPRRLYEQGKVEEARKEYNELIDKYPENRNIKDEFVEFTRTLDYKNLARDADHLFYVDKDYKSARFKYQEALKIKSDEVLRDKIHDCIEQEERIAAIAAVPVEPIPVQKQDPIIHEPEKKKAPGKSLLRILAFISVPVIITAGYLVYQHVFASDTEKPKPPVAAILPAGSTDSTSNHEEQQPEAPDKPHEIHVQKESSGLTKPAAEGKKLFNKNRFEEAFPFLDKAKNGNDIEVWKDLGIMYDEGKGVAEDHAEAVKWYKKAADKGDADMQYRLGAIYENGEPGIEQNLYEAEEWYYKAEKQDNNMAIYRLGLMHYEGRHLAKDLSKALEFFQRAAALNNPEAKVKLGSMYQQGEGTAKNPDEAFRLYKEAAEQGNISGQAKLAMMYAMGSGCSKDEAEAFKWCRNAAEQDDAGAQANLGWMYEKGLGVESDLLNAANWYRRAAKQGNTKAKQHLKRLGFKE